MGTMDDRLEQHNSELLDGVYDCVDRIVLNGYFRLATSAGGFRTWWRQLFGTDDNLDNNHRMRLAGRTSRRAVPGNRPASPDIQGGRRS